jgi:trimeric autotransporter adhesin
MPVAGTPGAQASSLYGQADTQGANLFGASQEIAPALSSLYSGELTNPQGFGATTLAQMLTQSDQSVAGGLGAARQTATDLGARTGNTAAIPGIIGSADKAGITQHANAVNSLGIANANEKMAQQQQGAAGLSGLYNADLGAGLNAEGLADKAVNTRISANQQSQGQFDKLLGAGLGAATGGLSSIAGGLGNLDSTGGSSVGEQIGNFFTGFGGGTS